MQIYPRTARDIQRINETGGRRPLAPASVLRASVILRASRISFRDEPVSAAAWRTGVRVLRCSALNGGQSLSGIRIIDPMSDGGL